VLAKVNLYVISPSLYSDSPDACSRGAGYERPVLRKGIVAGLNFSQRSIVLDCPSFPGNSGSPVLEAKEEGIGSRKFRIIGVISEFVPSEEIGTNTRYNYSNSTILNSGYSVATPIDSVLELLDNDD
jgi:hypothetical protein